MQKGTNFTVYGNRFNDKEINLKFPDVYKVHAIHEAAVSGVDDTDMFDRVLMNSTTGLVKVIFSNRMIFLQELLILMVLLYM